MSADPSAVDPGGDVRVPRESAVAIGAVAATMVLTVAATTGVPVVTLLAGFSAAGVAWAVGLLRSDRARTVTTGAFVWLAGAAGVCVALVVPGPALPPLAASITAFGATLSFSGAGGDGGVLDAGGLVTYALVTLWLFTFGVALVPVAGEVLGWIVSAFVPANAGPDVLGFAVLVALTVGAVRSALRGLPIAELSPKSDRGRVQGLLDQTDDALTKALWIALGGVVLALALAVALSRVVLPPFVVEAIAVPAGTPVLRGPLFVLFVVAGVVAVGSQFLEVTGGPILRRSRRVAAAVGGLAFGLGVVAAHPLILRGIVLATGIEGILTADLAVKVVGLLGLADVALLFVLLVGLCLPIAARVGVIPGRAIGPAIAAAGLVVAAVAVASVAGPTVTAGNPVLAVGHALVVIALVVGALVTWDLGEFGVGLGEEVGPDDDTRRVQAVHAAGTAGVAAVASVVAGLVAVVLAANARGLVRIFDAAGRIEVLALAAAVVGVFLLAAALRG